MITLGENRYGKSRVRLVRVKHGSERHEMHEWSVNISLEGDFESCFTQGDNSKILATDTMKNTVYSLARKSSARSIEQFAKELIDFFLSRNTQVSAAEVTVSQKAWEHAPVAGQPHPTTFVQSSAEVQLTKVNRKQRGQFSVASGLDNLIIMKTADSAFEGYVQDSLTTLPPTSDRLLATAVRAEWNYALPDLDFEQARAKIRETLIGTFAGHVSKSVQHTLYAMGERVLQTAAQVSDIELTMPNIHCSLVDLSRFGQDNPNEIFVPTDEPHGYIEARIRRQG